MVQNGSLSMSYLLHMIRLKEITKPVDRVYGLLGILGENMRSAIKVDYIENDQKYWKAYVDLAKEIVAADDRAYWLLCMASSSKRPQQLPTWCPNFNSSSADYLDFGDQNWRAGVASKPTQHDGIRFVKGFSNIQVPGFLIDVVDEVVHIGGPYSPVVGQDRGRDGNIVAFLERDRLCLELTRRQFDDVDDAQDAYARTLIVNSWIDGSLIQPSQRERLVNSYEDSKAYLSQIAAGNTANTRNLIDTEGQQLSQEYITQLGWRQERPFYTTNEGRIGRGAFNMQTGDAIAILYNAGPVFILRSEGERQDWNLVGDGYLHGCMDLDSMPEKGREADEVITIA